MHKIVVHFSRFGPYHFARLRSAREAFGADFQVTGLEVSSTDATYDWREDVAADSPKVTVFPGRTLESLSHLEMRRGVFAALDRLSPDVVAVAGWGPADARACLAWCRSHGVKAVVMSETRRADGKRVWWKEWLKSRVIREYGAGLVGGSSHADYLASLGMPRKKIHSGYNVVDNEYFEREAARHREGSDGDLENPYFLASNRFVERKNLALLIQAYHQHVSSGDSPVWPLVLLGDGEEKVALVSRCTELGLAVAEGVPWQAARGSSGAAPTVWFPGFRQIDELPAFYARAGCFVHPAREEPWGLVLNEAMACSLPVLSSSNVGAAEELVHPGMSGWTFDPANPSALAGLLDRVAAMPAVERREMGRHARRILEETAPLSAFGVGLRAAAGFPPAVGGGRLHPAT